MNGRLLGKIYSENIFLFWIGGIFLFASIYELATIILINKKIKKANPKQIALLYMLLKSGKLFIFIFMLAIYLLTIKVKTVRFIWITVMLYFIYFLIDTFFFISTEKKIKKEI